MDSPGITSARPRCAHFYDRFQLCLSTHSDLGDCVVLRADWVECITRRKAVRTLHLSLSLSLSQTRARAQTARINGIMSEIDYKVESGKIKLDGSDLFSQPDAAAGSHKSAHH